MAAMHNWQAGAIPGPAFPTVIAYLDGSMAARHTLAVARRVAEGERATLHIAFRGSSPGEARRAVEELQLAPREFRGVVFDHVADDAPEELIRLARELPGSLLAVPTTEDEGEAETLGSLAEAVLRGSPSCLLLVSAGQGSGWRLRHIVMAHDGTRSSDHAMPTAATLAHHAGAEVIALHVATRGEEEDTALGSFSAPRYIDQPQHEWPAWAGEFLERMLAAGNPPAALNFKLLVTGGQPGSEIAQFARDRQADLVILPWHGKWLEQQAGAVDVVVRRSGCPVLLICTA